LSNETKLFHYNHLSKLLKSAGDLTWNYASQLNCGYAQFSTFEHCEEPRLKEWIQTIKANPDIENFVLFGLAPMSTGYYLYGATKHVIVLTNTPSTHKSRVYSITNFAIKLSLLQNHLETHPEAAKAILGIEGKDTYGRLLIVDDTCLDRKQSGSGWGLINVSGQAWHTTSQPIKDICNHYPNCGLPRLLIS
jgi:hypothetical protein